MNDDDREIKCVATTMVLFGDDECKMKNLKFSKSCRKTLELSISSLSNSIFLLEWRQ